VRPGRPLGAALTDGGADRHAPSFRVGVGATAGGADGEASRGAPEARARGEAEAAWRCRRGGDATPGGGADRSVDGERGD